MELRFNNEFEWMKIGSPNGHRFVEVTCDTIKDKLIIKDAVGNKIEFNGWVIEDYLINSSPSDNNDLKKPCPNCIKEYKDLMSYKAIPLATCKLCGGKGFIKS